MAQRHRQTTINIDKDIKSMLEQYGIDGNYASWDELMLYILSLMKDHYKKD